jgi:hypothetical protein
MWYRMSLINKSIVEAIDDWQPEKIRLLKVKTGPIQLLQCMQYYHRVTYRQCFNFHVYRKETSV